MYVTASGLMKPVYHIYIFLKSKFESGMAALYFLQS